MEYFCRLASWICEKTATSVNRSSLLKNVTWMEKTKGILQKLTHHQKLMITINENCAIGMPEYALQKFHRPHKLDFYYFVYMDEGSASYMADMKDITVADGELIFGVPNQLFRNPINAQHNKQCKLGFDESTLALLPNAYPFLLNPLNSNKISFDPSARIRVKAIMSMLFQLIHRSEKAPQVNIILAHLNSLLTELNGAYFENAEPAQISNSRLSKYIAFKLAVESQLSEHHDLTSVAAKLATTPGNLYGIVKEFAGVSPKEFITNRLILEAQRRLRYAPMPVKELAYELGFTDPNYFSRLFKKHTGKSIRSYLSDLQNLSRN